MLRDILTVYFIVAGCLLLWLNFRPYKVVLTKEDDADVAHTHPAKRRMAEGGQRKKGAPIGAPLPKHRAADYAAKAAGAPSRNVQRAKQNGSDDDLGPVPHFVTKGVDRLTGAEDGDAGPEGDLALEADLQRIALEEMARHANPQARRLVEDELSR
jgi:hypothetical protein